MSLFQLISIFLEPPARTLAGVRLRGLRLPMVGYRRTSGERTSGEINLETYGGNPFKHKEKIPNNVAKTIVKKLLDKIELISGWGLNDNKNEEFYKDLDFITPEILRNLYFGRGSS